MWLFTLPHFASCKRFLQTSSNLSSCLMTYIERCSLSAHQPSRKQERRQKLLPEPTRLNRYCFRQKLHFLAACCSKRRQEIIRNWGLKDLKACTGHCDNSWFGHCKAFSSSTSRYRQPHGVFKEPGWKTSTKCNLNCDLCLSRILGHSRLPEFYWFFPYISRAGEFLELTRSSMCWWVL